jgi:hypothetical protein
VVNGLILYRVKPWAYWEYLRGFTVRLRLGSREAITGYAAVGPAAPPCPVMPCYGLPRA